ncbi:MAG: hypothetical protein JST91_23765 [Actinobacteria bacterium]|nr:hypothetical protein [Actinomycetota bacterium]
MRNRRRAAVELLLALAFAGGCAASWMAARSVVAVGPILPGEPSTISVVYSQPLLALAFLLATAAGVLGVLGVARLRRGGQPSP